jgi:mannose-6-phosphate isomerase-like protein (cupin superfamily)
MAPAWQAQATGNASSKGLGEGMTDASGPPPMVLRPGEGEQLPFIGTFRDSAGDTGGALEVIEYTGPAIPPPHVHREHDEIFIILTGTFRFVLGHDTAEAPQGAVVLVPRVTRHGFTVEPGSTALLLTIPAGLGGFFKELGAGLAQGRPSEEIRASLAGKYDSHPA